MRALLIIVVVAAWLVPAILSPFHAYLLYVWYSLFQAENWSWLTLQPLRLPMLLGLLLVGRAALSFRLPNLTHPLAIGSALFLGIGLLSQVTAFDSAAGWNALDLLGTMVVVSLLGISLTRTRTELLAVMGVVGVSLGLHGAHSGLSITANGGGRLLMGIGGAVGDNNAYGLALSRILPLLIGVIQNVERRWLKAGLAVAIPFCLVAIVATFSRGAFLAVAASVMAFALLQRRKGAAVVALSLAAALGAALVPSSYEERLGTVSNFEEDRSAAGRIHFWQVAVEMARDRPLGVGLGNYERAYDTYDFSEGEHGSSRSAHSIHFQVLGETGVPGLIVFESLLAYSLWVLWRIRARSTHAALSEDTRHFLFTTSNALMVSSIAFLVGGSFLSQALNDLNWLTLSMVASLDRFSTVALARATAPEAAPAPAAPVAPARGSDSTPAAVRPRFNRRTEGAGAGQGTGR